MAGQGVLGEGEAEHDQGLLGCSVGDHSAVPECGVELGVEGLGVGPPAIAVDVAVGVRWVLAQVLGAVEPAPVVLTSGVQAFAVGVSAAQPGEKVPAVSAATAGFEPGPGGGGEVDFAGVEAFGLVQGAALGP